MYNPQHVILVILYLWPEIANVMNNWLPQLGLCLCCYVFLFVFVTTGPSQRQVSWCWTWEVRRNWMTSTTSCCGCS